MSIAAALYSWNALNLGSYTIPTKSGREGVTVLQSETPYIFALLISASAAWAIATFTIAIRKTISLRNRDPELEKEIDKYIKNINSKAPSGLKPLGYGIAVTALISIIITIAS